MPSTPLRVRKAAVLGAGVMGAQIAAHLSQAGIETCLYDLPAKEGPKNAIALKAIEHLKKLSPPPLAVPEIAAAIIPANYEEHLADLQQADLIIEAIAERLDLKRDLYHKIAPYLRDDAILASNTSGLSIQALADALPEALQPRFCGVHFFNPPRYMYLVELIPARRTKPQIIEQLESLLTTTLGKGVVHARDTANFIGNRIGAFSILSVIYHTERSGLGLDIIDALTGPSIGRPKSATYRTADVVGLDTLSHVIKTMQTLENDPWNKYFQLSTWITGLIERGALGQKTGVGLYRKQGKEIQVLDLATGEYHPSKPAVAEEVAAILALPDPAARFKALHDSSHPQAEFLWACFRDLFHYSAYHLAEIAGTVRDVDAAIRWGYGWKQGPFEIWQAAGWKSIATWIQADIEAGRSMSQEPLPAWVTDGREGVYTSEGAYAADRNSHHPRSAHPVYQRQLFSQPEPGEKIEYGRTLWQNDGVRLWLQGDDKIGILSFKTKKNTLNGAVLSGIEEAVSIAERELDALVIWQYDEPFSFGADLKGAIGLVLAGESNAFTDMVAHFQRATSRVKHALVPVVAAVRGMALGGGCELQMHSARTVAALESYIGLVEAGVGLLPAGGGLKEFAVRAAAARPDDPFEALKQVFETVAMAKVSASALDAKRLGLLRESDIVVVNANELLYVAKRVAASLAEGGWRPPLPTRAIPVAGRTGIANFRTQLANLKAGYFISEHDEAIAARIADAMCGGEVEPGSLVDEDWLLALERQHFTALGAHEKTQARITHTLSHGKPLRN